MTGILAIAAGTSLFLSGLCLAIFFSTWDERWGRLNDATIALFAALMVPVAFAVHERSGSGWFAGTATAAGVVEMLLIAGSSALTALGRLDWRRSARVGAAGFAGFLVWMAATVEKALTDGSLPAGLTWFGLLTLAVATVAIGSAIRFVRAGGLDAIEAGGRPHARTVAPFVVALCCFPVWAVWLGLALRGRG